MSMIIWPSKKVNLWIGWWWMQILRYRDLIEIHWLFQPHESLHTFFFPLEKSEEMPVWIELKPCLVSVIVPPSALNAQSSLHSLLWQESLNTYQLVYINLTVMVNGEGAILQPVHLHILTFTIIIRLLSHTPVFWITVCKTKTKVEVP